MTDDLITFDTLMTRLEIVLRERAPLHAVYGPGGTFDHTRKILLASCRDAHRLTKLGNNEKVTEALLDDLGHADADYVAFVETATAQRTTLALLDAEATLLEHRLSHLKAKTYENAQLARMQ